MYRLLRLLNLIFQSLYITLDLTVRRPRVLPFRRHLRLHIRKTNRHTEFLVCRPRRINHANDLRICMACLIPCACHALLPTWTPSLEAARRLQNPLSSLHY